MKQLRYLSCIALVLLSFVSTASAERMKFENDYVPLQIQRDLQQYLDHATKDVVNHELVISDLQTVLQHIQKPSTDDIQKDPQRWTFFNSLVFEHVRRELRMSAQLCIAAHYHAMDNKEKALEWLPTTRDMERRYEGKLGGASMLTDYISALSAYKKSKDKIGNIIDGSKYGYDERIQVMVTMIQSYACMQRCLQSQPYDCMQRRESPAPSECSCVNYMLVDALIQWPVYGLNMKDKSEEESVDEILRRVLRQSQEGVVQAVKEFLEALHGSDNNLLYLCRFVLDYVNETSDELLSSLSKYSILHCLSELGYAPASLELGLRTETGKFNDMRPYDPKTRDVPDYQQVYRFYEKAVGEGSETANILLGRCLFYGAGCKANKKLALQMLQPMVGHDDFPKYGAFAYANLLLDKQMGLKYEPVEVFELMCQAAQSSYDEDERQGAREIIEGTYEQYFK